MCILELEVCAACKKNRQTNKTFKDKVIRLLSPVC